MTIGQGIYQKKDKDSPGTYFHNITKKFDQAEKA